MLEEAWLGILMGSLAWPDRYFLGLVLDYKRPLRKGSGSVRIFKKKLFGPPNLGGVKFETREY